MGRWKNSFDMTACQALVQSQFCFLVYPMTVPLAGCHDNLSAAGIILQYTSQRKGFYLLNIIYCLYNISLYNYFE